MKNKLIFLIVSLLSLCGCSDDSTVTERNNNPHVNFDALWNILDQRYCYFTSKGIDWDNIYYEYSPKAYKVKDVFQLFDIMESMLDSLQDGHVNLYTPFDISVCSGWYSDYPADFYQYLIYNYIEGKYRSVGGFQYGIIKNNNIGYIRYGSFTSYPSPNTLAYIDAYFSRIKVNGIIIDVRNNGGGNLLYSTDFAGSFFKEKVTTGYMQHKIGFGHDDFSKPEPIYTDPVTAPIDWSDKKIIVLTNRLCYSATNDFIVRVKEAPNVTVVGGITGGGGGLPLSQELPNGWMVRFSAVPMFDSEMRHTEFGVNPDVEIHISDEQQKDGCDAIIEKAIELINKEK